MNNSYSLKSDVPPSSREEWVSALMDGELDKFDEYEIDDLVDHPEWETYHLIGDVMRSSDLAWQPSAEFNARLVAAIQQEQPHTSSDSHDLPKFDSSSSNWLAGLALAASVFGVTWLIKPDMGLQSQPVVQTAVAQSSVNLSETIRASSEVTPYLNAHRQFVGFSPYRQVSEREPMRTASQSFNNLN